MENMINALNDDTLETVTGGFLSVSAWIAYAAQNVVTPLDNLARTAAPADQAQVQNIANTIRGTFAGQGIVATVNNVYNSYVSTGHNAIANVTLKNAVRDILFNAYTYINNNK